MDEQTLRKILKEELKGFATKEDLKGFATKEDLASTEARLEQKIQESETRLMKVITKEAEDLDDLIGEGFKGLDMKADKAEVSPN